MPFTAQSIFDFGGFLTAIKTLHQRGWLRRQHGIAGVKSLTTSQHAADNDKRPCKANDAALHFSTSSRVSPLAYTSLSRPMSQRPCSSFGKTDSFARYVQIGIHANC